VKIIDKALAFLDLSRKKLQKRREKFRSIIEKLENAKLKVKHQYKSEKNKKRKEKYLDEFLALSKLLKKSKKRLKSLKE